MNKILMLIAIMCLYLAGCNAVSKSDQVATRNHQAGNIASAKAAQNSPGQEEPKTTANTVESPAPTDENPVKTADAVNGKPIAIPAKDLYMAIKGTGKQENQNYTGKLLDVTGEIAWVNAVKTRNLGNPSLALKAIITNPVQQSFTTVECGITDKDSLSALPKLSVGSTVTIEGTCIGMHNGTVRLENSKIIR